MQKKKANRLERYFFVLLSFLSPRLNTILQFYKKFGRTPDLKTPLTLNEKLLKLKLERYGKDTLVQRCADKYRVRDFVRERGYEEILVPLLAVYDHPEEIEWNELPDRFVVKWNFGCGYNLICTDKSLLDIPAAVHQLRRWGSEPFWAYYSELQYRAIPKRILVEMYLGSADGHLPSDYKFYCFHGQAYCVMLCEGRNNGWPNFYFFDREFHLLRINRDSLSAPEDFTLSKPDGLEKAFEVADCLSAGFPFVRVDLYLIDGRVYFGEMTFTPAAALDNKRLPETDLLFGSMLHLDGDQS